MNEAKISETKIKEKKIMKRQRLIGRQKTKRKNRKSRNKQEKQEKQEKYGSNRWVQKDGPKTTGQAYRSKKTDPNRRVQIKT